jgi:hypothetical protein
MATTPHINSPVDVYKTTSLDLAAFLKSQGHPIIGSNPNTGALVEFIFPSSELIHFDVETYYTGTAMVRPLQLFETYHSLRSMVLALRHSVRRHDPRVGGVR